MSLIRSCALIAVAALVAACASGNTTAIESSATSAKPATAATAAPAKTTAPPVDPGTLPQTDEKPTAAGSQWDTDTKALWQAIVDDDPQQGRAFFFPLAAYKQVKAISDPAGDYDKRLIAYYEDDIHKLRKQLGADASRATFVRLEVPATAQWIKPGVEYNKGAYWRVFDSKLVYRVDGKDKSFVVKSMISWRGQWYVVHLSSIR